MVGDGKTAYDNDNDGKDNEVGSCIEPLRNKDGNTKAMIKYIRPKQVLQVLVYISTHQKVLLSGVRETNDWEVCFTVGNITLPPSGYLGLTAHTGDVFGSFT